MSLPILTDPTPEEVAQMRIDAKSAEGCLDWHQHCHAECCSQFSIVDDAKYDLSQQWIRYFGNASSDMIWYYKLHGCKYRMPWLYIPTKNARRYDGRIFFLQRCKLLTVENKCSGHPNRKPKVCRDLTVDNLRANAQRPGSLVTKRCLFRFKLEEPS